MRSLTSKGQARCGGHRSFLLAATLLLSLTSPFTVPAAAQEVLQPAICFAPGTSEAEVAKRIRQSEAATGHLLRPSLQPGLGKALEKYQPAARWTVTATNGGGLTQGDPTVLTWSIVPDGTSIFGYAGEPTAPSNLQAFLTGIYGSQAAWLAIIQQVFDRWSELTGITYVYEPNDDGAPFLQFSLSPGVLGVRGDIRMSGHFIDGTSGTLAYNFFPNFGDMVLDTGDGTFFNTSGNSLRLRNTLAHEHGHGIGLNHVCPVNQTKLMEPFLSLAFDGPRHDDILGAQRHYGDTFEHNDTAGTATGLGPFAPGDSVLVPDVSVDDDLDTNFFAFTVAANNAASITVQPIGLTYLQGPQNSNGSCSPGASFNSLTLHDLGVEVLDADGATVLATADLNPAGQSESLTGVPLPSGAGTYYVRVHGSTTNNAQLYQLGLSVDGPVCGNGVLEAGEVCDGADLGGETCVSQGFSGGTLTCNNTCSAFVTTACFTCRNGKTLGAWNLPTSTTRGKVSGTLYRSNGQSLYDLLAGLAETSPGRGTLSGTLSRPSSVISHQLTPPLYRVSGTWQIDTPPSKGTFEADVYDYQTGVHVGRIKGDFKDDPLSSLVGDYEGEWEICD